MIPAEYDITIYRGATFSLPMSYTDGDGLVNFQGTYTGARMQIRPAVLNVPDAEVPPDDPAFDLSTANGKLIMLSTALTISLSAADTAALPLVNGVYDLELYITATPEIVDKFLYGKITVKGEVTIPIVEGP
jgi:hypothetical protein